MFCDRVDVDSLEYREPQSNKSGGKVVQVTMVPGSLEWKDRVRFQMSEDQTRHLQTAVWGLSTPLAGQDAARRTLELTIESPALLAFLNRLDEKNIATAVAKSTAWFRKEIDLSTVRAMYVHLVKPPSKAGYPSSVRVKVKCNEYPTNIYVVKEETADGRLVYDKGGPDDLAKGAKCMVMVETTGLWFMSRQFGMSLAATEILVWPAAKNSGIDAFTLSSNVILQKGDKGEDHDEDMPMAS